MKTKMMSAKEQLNNYILRHPDFWEYADEVLEVQRLKKLSEEEAIETQLLNIQNQAHLEHYSI